MKKKTKVDVALKAVEDLNTDLKGIKLFKDAQKNLELFKQLFIDDDMIVFRQIKSKADSGLSFYLIYCDGLVNSVSMNQFIIQPLMEMQEEITGDEGLNELLEKVVCINQAVIDDKLTSIIQGITSGDAFLFIEGSAKGIILNTKGYTFRSISEPEGEKVLNGPREGFCEVLMTNLGLIKRKVSTNQLKTKIITMGEQTQTRIAIVYIDSIVDRKALNELLRRLKKIKMDSLLDENYITEQIKDNPYSPFRTIGLTERPDIVVARLLEGRVALLTDGAPSAATLPYLFMGNFQSNEDYYMNYYYTSFSRALRFAAFLITIIVPALYVMFLTYHHEMLPPKLMISIAIERQSVPLPIPLEAFLLLIMFEVLRETGIRMPSSTGQALSIVGALVIGQSAVEAKLVSASMIIVIALVGITGLVIPKMNSPIIYMRFLLLALASLLGFVGFCLGCSVILIHILNLKSFGVNQISLDRKLKYQRVKDSFIRAPWWSMKTRPSLTKNVVRTAGDSDENK